MRRSLLGLPLLVLLACGGESGGNAPACEPGATNSCVCGDFPGTATCDEHGRYGACVCAGTVVWAPAALEFGEVQRARAVEATLSVWNEAEAAVPIRSVALAPGTSPAFAIVSSPAAVPAAGRAALVIVSFASDVAGDATGTLVIELDGRNAIEVPLHAAAVGPDLACDSAPLEFGPRTPGARSTLQVWCTNTGAAGLEEAGYLHPTAILSDDPEFSGTVGAGPIAPGQGFAVDVQYLPVDLEADHATLRLVTAEGLEASIAATGSVVAERCELEAAPVVLAGVPGEDLAGEVAIRNLRQDAGCLVDHVAPDPGCAGAFAFDLPAPGAAIAPGAVLPVPVALRSDEQAVYDCSLRVFAHDPDGTELAVPIEAAVSWRPCLAVEGPTELPAISPLCGPTRVDARLVNRCRRDFPVDTLRLLDPPYYEDRPAAGFSVALAVPATIPAQGELPLPVAYDPEPDDEGARTVRATLVLGSHLDADPWRFDFTSERLEDELRTRISHQPGGGLLDILVVIDNGVGMAPEIDRVLSYLGPMPERLAGWDYRLAVTTTGLTPTTTGTCPGGVAGGEDGRFVPLDGTRPRVIQPTTPNARAVWEANLAVGACSDQPAQPFEAALQALLFLANKTDDQRHPEPDDGNAGFLRRTTPLLLVFVGDRDDTSTQTSGYYFSWIESTRPVGSFDVVTIAGPPVTGCTGPDGVSAAPGNRLHEFASFLGGTEHSICGGPWTFLDRFDLSLQTQVCFPTPASPTDRNGDGLIDSNDLEVRVAGIRVEPMGPDGVHWIWDREAARVCFADDSVPPPGVAIAVESLACE